MSWPSGAHGRLLLVHAVTSPLIGPPGAGRTMLCQRVSSRQIKRHCALDDPGESLLRQEITDLGLSARAHDRILRIARTIADLAGEEHTKPDHLAEAIQYWRLDRQL